LSLTSIPSALRISFTSNSIASRTSAYGVELSLIHTLTESENFSKK
jgi:hypothetical protein